jgi:hypothetical protein
MPSFVPFKQVFKVTGSFLRHELINATESTMSMSLYGLYLRAIQLVYAYYGRFVAQKDLADTATGIAK